LLNALRTAVSPKYEPRWYADDPKSGKILAESWKGIESDPRKELMTALKSWADRFRITDEWIVQTALHMLQAHSKYKTTPYYLDAIDDEEWCWLYVPQSTYPRFQFRTNVVEDSWFLHP
jgi:hypothetical protein